jgi:hypothetical protein
LANNCNTLVANASGTLFALGSGYQPNEKIVFQLGLDSSGHWSFGSSWTSVLDWATCLAVQPNGTLLAGRLLANDPDGVWSSPTGHLGSWQLSYGVPGGVYTIAVTPNGVAYALPYSGLLKYSTTGLANSWQTVSWVAPGYGWINGPGSVSNVVPRGLANGQDGQVYFLAGGNVYEVLPDGNIIVRAQISAHNGTSLDAALNGVSNVMAVVSSYLQLADGTDQTAMAIINRVDQYVHTTSQQTTTSAAQIYGQLGNIWGLARDILELDVENVVFDINSFVGSC